MSPFVTGGTAEGSQQYYVDYNSLEQHFRNDHFTCIDQECLEKKFIVFDSEMDLKAHQLQAQSKWFIKRRTKRCKTSGYIWIRLSSSVS